MDVTSLGMGCGRLGSSLSRADDRAGRAAVERALELGITFFDTADGYGRGRSERILGAGVRSVRDRVTIATKCGLVRTPSTMAVALRTAGAGRTLAAIARARRSHREYSPAYVTRAAEASLRRLGSDYIDILLLHSPPRPVLAEAGFVDALERLRARGVVRAWGVSLRGGDDGPGDAQLALALPGLEWLEVELNLCAGWAIDAVLPAARETGISVIARQPFGSGTLFHASEPSAVAACLQFPIGVDGVAVTIAGMSRPEHVSENVEAAFGPPVGADEVARLRDVLC
jgi:aryl-alcohol dehydrogenase-like predicted oxidoreductase